MADIVHKNSGHKTRKSRAKSSKRKVTSPILLDQQEDKKLKLNLFDNDTDTEVESYTSASEDPNLHSDSELFYSQTPVTIEMSDCQHVQGQGQGETTPQAPVDPLIAHSQLSQAAVYSQGFTQSPNINQHLMNISQSVPNMTSMSPMVMPMHFQNPVVQSAQSAHQVGYQPLPDSEIERIAAKMKDFICLEIEALVDSKVKARTQVIHDEMHVLKSENSRLRSQIDALESKVDDLEQYSRRKCLRISNYPEPAAGSTENTDNIVVEVAEDAGIPLNASDIDVSHRVGKPKQGRPRDIIVKFLSTYKRNEVIKGRKVLRNKKASVFISEDLTKSRDELLFQCRSLAKDENSRIDKTWSYNGKIFVQLKNSKSSFRVFSKDDLISFRPVNPTSDE